MGRKSDHGTYRNTPDITERRSSMKVFIAVDLEGVPGYVRWDAPDRNRERELITETANAAVAGAVEGGAEEVLVTEAHGNMRNILPERIDPRATFLSGQPKPMNHMAGVDESFDAAMLVGYHAKAGALRGVMSHTYAGSVFSLKFNGLEVGEIGADAALAGYFGVPVVLVSGDRVACAEAEGLLRGVKTVSVKEGVTRSAARCLPPEEAYRHIQEGAREALGCIEDVAPLKIEAPVRVEIVFTDPSYADTVSSLPFVQRMDGRTVSFEGADYRAAFELFNGLHFLAGAVR